MDLQLRISERYLRFVQLVAVVCAHSSVMQWLVVFCVTSRLRLDLRNWRYINHIIIIIIMPLMYIRVREVFHRVVRMFCQLTVVIDYSEHLIDRSIGGLID